MVWKRSQFDRYEIEVGGLLEFVRRAWHVVIPTPFRENWHHALICRKLEAWYEGDIRNLLIMVPPGSTKTLLTGVFGPAYAWTRWPEMSFIYTTYGGSLTLKAARQMRDLVNSEWYQNRWPGVKIPYQNTHAAAFFENSKKGFRFSGSTGGEVTGRHANKLVGDDLNKSQDAMGNAGLTMTNLDSSWDFWSGVLPTRQSDPQTTGKLLIGQALHENDVPHRWLATGEDIEVVCLPMHLDLNHPHYNKDNDPRKEQGELLWPDHIPEEEVETLERTLGPVNAAAQLEQNPLPVGGRVIDSAYLEHRYTELPAALQRALNHGRLKGEQHWATFWDLNFKGKEAHSRVSGQVWCWYESKAWLVDAVVESTGFLGALRMIRDLAAAYPWILSHKIEDAANASATLETLRAEVPGVELVSVDGGTLARTQAILGLWSSGCVMLPASAPYMGGAHGFVAEHLAFDGLKSRWDDQVSTSSLAILNLSRTGKKTSWAQKVKQAARAQSR